jgi:predicted ATP-dependent endonuclease of OLD family
VVYAIEEPETSQHPNNQEMLIRALLALSRRSGTQVLVTTHVPALAGLLPSDSVLFVENTPNGPTVSTASDDVLECVVRTLGVLPQREVAGAKALILVEGEGDVVFLNHSAMALKAAGHLSHSLVEKKIMAIPTGGLGNLNAWVTKRTADQLGRPWAVFIDSDQDGTDPEPFLKNCALMEGLRASGTKAHMTRKREAENYLLPQVIHVQVNTAASAALGYGEFIDAKPLISQATSVRANKLLETFWPAMTAEHILQADEYTDNSGVARHEIVEALNDLLSLA